MKNVMRWIVGLSLTSMACVGSAAESRARSALDLRADRYSDAAVVATISDGTAVEPLKSEAGWVQVKAGGKVGWVRATGLTGDGATVASLARLEGGRSASGNLVVAAGIRRIPKASKHALIIAVESTSGIGAPLRRWPGVVDDLVGARLIAGRLGIPDENTIEVTQTSDTLDGVRGHIAGLNDRVQPGDQVLVYFSGPGTRIVEDGVCVPAWTMLDGQSLSAASLVRLMKPALANADKVLFVSDAAFAASAKEEAARKVVPSNCTTTTTTMPIVELATAAGASALNVVALQSAAGASQGIDVPRGGGLFTQALTDCVLGDAIDADRSASISITEIATCVNQRGKAGPLATIAGNTGWSPIVGVSSTVAASGGTSTPRAAIDDVVAQRDGRIDVTLIATPTTLQIGRDYLDLALTSSRAGYVYLVLLGSDGKSFYLLFPNDLDRDNRIAAGETLRLPRPNWRVQGQGPSGKDTVLAIVAESPRDLSALAAHKEGPFSTSLTDVQGKAQLQWLLGQSGKAGSAECVGGGKRRNLAAVGVCSDAFGAGVVEVEER